MEMWRNSTSTRSPRPASELTRRRLRGGLIGAVAATLLALSMSASVAAAQTPGFQGGTGPNGGALPTTQAAGPNGGGQNGSATSTSLATGPPIDQALLVDAAVVVAEKAAVLDRLGAFTADMPPPLQTIIDTVAWDPEATHDELLTSLAELDAEGQRILTEFGTQGSVSAEVAGSLSVLPAEQQSAVASGQTGVVTAGPYLSAIDDLITRGGQPGQRGAGTVDAAALATAIAAARGTEVPTDVAQGNQPLPTTTAAPSLGRATTPTQESKNDQFPLAAVAAIVPGLAIAAAIAFTFFRRGRGGAPARFDELLEVSRALALAQERADVERIAAFEAARLLGVQPPMAAFVRRTNTEIEAGFEVPSELLVPDRLADGTLGRVVETGEGIASIVTQEPALRSLPAALACVPVIGRGQVEGVILVVRTPEQPFSDDDLAVLRKVGPIVAAALTSASRLEASNEASLTDPLTGVGNRRKLERDLQDLLATASGPTALAMVDLDHFKAVNDTYGHPAGDAVLRHVATTLSDVVRPADRIYRYGGEEFALLLADTDESDATVVADRARQSLVGEQIAVDEVSLPIPTASLGVAATSGPDDLDGLALITRADRALYGAKQDGRNRVVMATSVE